MKPNLLFKGKYTKKALFVWVPVILCAIMACVLIVSLNNRNAKTEKAAGGENSDIMSSERGDEEDMEKLYERINFENAPSKKTPLSEENLNKMDRAIDEVDNRVIDLNRDLRNSLQITKTDILSDSKFSQIYVKSDGSYVGSVSWQSYGITREELESSFGVEFYGYTNTVGFYAVGYYYNKDHEDFKTAEFIGGIQYSSIGGSKFVVKASDIPSNANEIYFFTRTASATDQTLFKTTSGLDAKISTNTDTITDHWGDAVPYTIPMEAGGIVGASGKDDIRTDRMRSAYLSTSEFAGTVKMPTGFSCIVHGYDENMNWVSAYPSTTWRSSFTWEELPTTFAYIRFVVDTGSLSSIITTDYLIYTNRQITERINDMAETDIPYTKKSLNQIARLGWEVYSASTPPEQSIDSYKLAYSHGCRIMLCDVRVTSDGQFVLWHDETLNNTVKHADGTALTSAELETKIADSTLAQLNAYDYGIYKGAEYAGMQIPTLGSFLNWCGLVDCIPMLEIKVALTESQCVEIANMCKMYGLGDRVIIDEYTTHINATMDTWIANLPKATISIIGGSAIDLVIPKVQKIIQAGLNAMVVLSSEAQLVGIQDDNGNIDYTKVQSVTNTGADLVYTEIQSQTELNNFYSNGYLSVFKYVSSSYVDINKWVRENLLLN